MKESRVNSTDMRVVNMAKTLGEKENLPLAKTIRMAAELVSSVEQAKKHSTFR
jgi:hypothetical protein